MAGCMIVMMALSVATAALSADEPAESVTLTGRVVALTEALAARGVPADTEPLAQQVVLEQEDGSILPLLPDESSRALFADERLRDRPLEIQGRRHPRLPYLQVVTFKVEDNGEWLTPSYYCEICSIRVRYPQICPCCQGEMELRLGRGTR